MASINTNASAMVALQTLNSTTSKLSESQNRISTGLKVNDARDDSAVWSIAQGMRSTNAAYDSVIASLNRGKSTLDVANTAGAAISDLLTQMQSSILAASDVSLDQTSRDSYQQKYQSLAKQITTYVNNAAFNGVNLLDGSTTSYSALANADGSQTLVAPGQDLRLGNVVATAASLPAISKVSLAPTDAGTFKIAVDGAAAATVTVAAGDTAATLVTKINTAAGATVASLSDTGALKLKSTTTGAGSSIALSSFTGQVTQDKLGFGSGPSGLFAEGKAATTGGGAVLQISGQETFTNATDYTALIAAIKQSITNVSGALGTLGASANAMSNHLTFVSKLQDSLTTGIGNLVDADVAKESANLQALQVKQQLGVQALSIANQSPQVILSLFK